MKESTHWNGWRIVLASASPRRKELLEQIGIYPEIRPGAGDENPAATAPEEIVKELSCSKAGEIIKSCREGELVIGADTVVAVDGMVLGKPHTVQKAVEMISMLQGRVHEVYTGVTLMYARGDGTYEARTFAEKTEVFVYPMTEEEIAAYAESGEPLDKAGAYGIQGRFAAYIREIRGDYTNVVGLPLGRLCQEIKNFCPDALFKHQDLQMKTNVHTGGKND